MGYSCAVHGCFSCKREKDRSFFRFPKDKLRCKQWVRACSRPDLENKSEEDLYKSHIICDLHFAESSRFGTRLKCNAIPTLQLPVTQEDVSLLTKSTQTIILSTCDKEIQTDEVVNPESTTAHSSKYTQITPKLTKKAARKRKLLRANGTKVKKRRGFNEIKHIANQNFGTDQVSQKVREHFWEFFKQCA